MIFAPVCCARADRAGAGITVGHIRWMNCVADGLRQALCAMVVVRHLDVRRHRLTGRERVVQMKVLGGAIGATSNPNHGSIFWFCFPIEEPPGSTSSMPLSSSWHPPSSAAANPAPPSDTGTRRSLPAPDAAPMDTKGVPVESSLARGLPRTVTTSPRRVAPAAAPIPAHSGAQRSDASSSQALSSPMAPTTVTTTNSPPTGGSSFWRSSHSTRRSGQSGTSYGSYNAGGANIGQIIRSAGVGAIDDDAVDASSTELPMGRMSGVGAMSPPQPPGSPALPGIDLVTPTAMGPSAGVTEVARLHNSPLEGAPLFLSLASDSLLYRRSGSAVPSGRLGNSSSDASRRGSGARASDDAAVDRAAAAPAPAAASVQPPQPPRDGALPQAQVPELQPGYLPAVPAVPPPAEASPILAAPHIANPALAVWPHATVAHPAYTQVPPPLPVTPWPDYALAMWSEVARVYGMPPPPAAVPMHYSPQGLVPTVPTAVPPGAVWPASPLYHVGSNAASVHSPATPRSPTGAHVHAASPAPPVLAGLASPSAAIAWSPPLLSAPHALRNSAPAHLMAAPHGAWPYPAQVAQPSGVMSPVGVASLAPYPGPPASPGMPVATGGVVPAGATAAPAVPPAAPAVPPVAPAVPPVAPEMPPLPQLPPQTLAAAEAAHPAQLAQANATSSALSSALGGTAATGSPPQRASRDGVVPESHAGSSSVCDSLSAWGQPRSHGGSFDEVRAQPRRSLEATGMLAQGSVARMAAAVAAQQNAAAVAAPDSHAAQRSVASTGPPAPVQGRVHSSLDGDRPDATGSLLGPGPPAVIVAHDSFRAPERWQHELALVPEASNEGTQSSGGDWSVRQSRDFRGSGGGSSAGSERASVRVAGSSDGGRGPSALKRGGGGWPDDGTAGERSGMATPGEASASGAAAPNAEGMAVASVSTVHSTHGYRGGSEDGLRSRTASQRSFGDEQGGSTPHDYGIEVCPLTHVDTCFHTSTRCVDHDCWP